jgi:SAM-dependent methyltransferase
MSVLRQDPSREWEAFGRNDPYFGVCTEEEYHRNTLGEDARARFFASGDRQMADILAMATSITDADWTPARVLEYGCGVGRLLIPAAKQAQQVLGVDVSPSMLAEARRNCEEFGVTNVDLVGTDELAASTGGFDLVYSIAVLQHVPSRAGEQILARLIQFLRPGGVGVVSLLVGADPQLARFNVIMKWPLAHNMRNLTRGLDWSYPYMQMNVYDLNQLTLVLDDHGVQDVRLRVGPRSRGFDFCTFFFRL